MNDHTEAVLDALESGVRLRRNHLARGLPCVEGNALIVEAWQSLGIPTNAVPLLGGKGADFKARMILYDKRHPLYEWELAQLYARLLFGADELDAELRWMVESAWGIGFLLDKALYAALQDASPQRIADVFALPVDAFEPLAQIVHDYLLPFHLEWEGENSRSKWAVYTPSGSLSSENGHAAGFNLEVAAAGVLSDRNLLQEIRRKQLLEVDPMPDESSVEGMCLEVHLGRYAKRTSGREKVTRSRIDGRNPVPVALDLDLQAIGCLVAEPGDWVVVQTHEAFRIADNAPLMGIISAKSRLGRHGLAFPTSAEWIHPGFPGQPGVLAPIYLEILIVGDTEIELYPGMAIAQVLFLRLSSAPERPYRRPHAA